MKKVLILTAERTGTGHKSAANAIEKELKSLGYETKQIDCFNMLKGFLGKMLENSYIPITTKCPMLFYIPYLLFSQTFPNILHFFIYLNSKKRFKKEFNEYKPDLIISVHSMFTKSISKIIKKENLNIPFYIDVIDLVKPPKVWMDKRAEVTFVPTEEVKQDYIKNGFEANKIIVAGFPIRSDIERRKTPKKIEDKINILMVNPSVNLEKNLKYVNEISRLSRYFYELSDEKKKIIDINVICGRDKRMYDALIKEQINGKISKDIRIHSFVNNMNEYLENAHILLTKAGPNMMLEGERSGTAVIVTGHVRGQENKNYEYIEKNKFGFKCENPNEIYDKLKVFIENKELEKCLKNVLNSDCSNGDKIIAKYIDEVTFRDGGKK